MFSAFEIEMQSEFNAQYDSVREAYAATQLDPIYEGWCSYCDACQQDGEEPMSFERYEFLVLNPERQADSHVRQYEALMQSLRLSMDDEIPF